jgi:hypothetical protein
MVAEIYIGLMTGTSADSLDIAAVNFLNDDITIIGEENFSIPTHLKEEIKKITNSNNLVRSSVEKLDLDLGEFFATKIDDFLKIHDLRHDEISAIGSHGQTIKHEPNSIKPFSLQAGAGGASVTIGGATGTQEVSGAADKDTSVIGVSVTSGNITANVSQASFEQASVDEESNGASVMFKVSDAMTLVAHTAETKDSVSSEKYTNSGIEVQYAIASGLTAYINVEDYDYKVGTLTSAVEADSGTASKLTIKATF